MARGGGADVFEGSVFDRLPRAGRWRTALLLDGNIGIGGCPRTLLHRLAGVLARDGVVLAELAAPGAGLESGPIQLEGAGRVSAPFAWARVGVDAVDGPAAAAGFRIDERWRDGGRWFVALARG